MMVAQISAQESLGVFSSLAFLASWRFIRIFFTDQAESLSNKTIRGGV
jgi:hypothetical protein